MVSKRDSRILECLQEDGRMSLAKIAAKVDMSENGVRYRVQKMEEEGVIRGISAVVDPEMVGKRVTAVFNISVETSLMRSTVSKLRQLDELIQVYQTTGDRCIMAVGLFDSREQLTDFINATLLPEHPIHDYEVEIVLRKFKDSLFRV